MPSKIADNIVPRDVGRQGIYDLTEEELKKLDETGSERFMKSLGKLKENIAKHSKIIFGLIALIVLAIVIYYINENFLFGSYREITIYVKDVEKRDLSENYLEIKDLSGKVVLQKSGESTYVITIQKGKYVVTVSATDYKKASKDIEVTESQTFTIFLERDTGVKIESINIPDTLYLGQNFAIKVNLKNYSPTQEAILFSLGADLNYFSCGLSEIAVPPNASHEVSVFCDIPENLKLNYNCEQKKALVRIKETNNFVEKNFSLCIKPTITLGEISFTLDPVTKNNERKDLTIKNNSPFHVKDLKLGIEITNAKENTISDILNWFAFSNVIVEPRNTRTILEIAPKATVIEPVEVSIPLTAKAETIYGNVVLTAPFLKDPIKSKLTLTIKRTARLVFNASLSTTKAVIAYKGDIPVELTVKVQIRNTGDLPVKNIDVKIDNPQECTTQWLRPLDVLSIASVEPGQMGAVALIASAPIDAAKGTTKRCIISMTYEDLLKGTIETYNIGFIEIVRG
ncbi:MAG: hypothetical protein QXM75_03100 [Candidatus Diapherotrites archaeon]